MSGLSVFSPSVISSRIVFFWWGKDSSRQDSFKETLMKILRIMMRIPIIAISGAVTYQLLTVGTVTVGGLGVSLPAFVAGSVFGAIWLELSREEQNL